MAEIIEIFRRRRPRSRAPYLIPAPTGGLDRRTGITSMPIDRALELVNLRPDRGYVQKRHGSRLHATLRVTDSPIEDTTPPQLTASGPPRTQKLVARHPFEIPLLSHLAAELVPITFTIHRVEASGLDTSWVGISEHGMLYGVAPEGTVAITYLVHVRARDPARNALNFAVPLLVLPGDAPMVVAPGAQLAVPDSITPVRFPQGFSPLVLVEFDRVNGADRYRLRHRNDGGLNEEGWTVVVEPASQDLLVLEGSGHVVQVQAVSDDDAVDDSAWSASVAVPDQEGKPVAVPDLSVARLFDRQSRDVTLTAGVESLPLGITRLAYQTRQDGGNWNVAVAFEGLEVTIPLAGSGWEVRWGAFEVADGYEVNDPGPASSVPDQVALPIPSSFAGVRHPVATDATVRFGFAQVENAISYLLRLSRDGTHVRTVMLDGLTTTTKDEEMPGDDWTAQVVAQGPAGWLAPPDWADVPSIPIQDQQSLGPMSFASMISATRPEGHKKGVSVRWTPGEGATEQSMEFRQHGGPWNAPGSLMPSALTAETNSVTVDLQGSGWRGRIVTADGQTPPEASTVEFSVPDQASLGAWEPYYLLNGSRIYGSWRRQTQDLGLVDFHLERRDPKSGLAGNVAILGPSGGTQIPYGANDDTAHDAVEAEPGITVNVAEERIANFVVPQERSFSVPARLAMEIANLGITRDDPDTVQFGGRASKDVYLIAGHATAHDAAFVSGDYIYLPVDRLNAENAVVGTNLRAYTKAGVYTAAQDRELAGTPVDRVAGDATRIFGWRSGQTIKAFNPADGALSAANDITIPHEVANVPGDREGSGWADQSEDRNDYYTSYRRIFIIYSMWVFGGKLYVILRNAVLRRHQYWDGSGYADERTDTAGSFRGLQVFNVADGAEVVAEKVALDSGLYGAWGDGTRFWGRPSSSQGAADFEAHRHSDGRRDSLYDLALDQNNRNAVNIASDGTTGWILDVADDLFYSYVFGGSGGSAVNKDVTLTWVQNTDRNNRALYAIVIQRRRSGTVNWADVAPVSAPVFDPDTNEWSAVVDADQRDGEGNLTSALWEFRVIHNGYVTTPILGSTYTVPNSNPIQNTAPTHAPPIVTV